MESLDEFNNRKSQEYDGPSKKHHYNGIACPKCGSELFDRNPNVTLTSYPPKKSIACQCGYSGYRIA